MAVIYKATNTVNGKSYIGIAADFENRKAVHLHNARKENGEKFYFHRAIRKYGETSFEWSILLENATLDDEIRLIAEHETYQNGYNLTIGGDGNNGWVMSEETKRKIGKKALGNKKCLGRVVSEETKRKISNSLVGKPLDEETKKKIGDAHRGRKQSPEFIKKRIDARMKTIQSRKDSKNG